MAFYEWIPISTILERIWVNKPPYLGLSVIQEEGPTPIYRTKDDVLEFRNRSEITYSLRFENNDDAIITSVNYVINYMGEAPTNHAIYINPVNKDIHKGETIAIPFTKLPFADRGIYELNISYYYQHNKSRFITERSGVIILTTSRINAEVRLARPRHIFNWRWWKINGSP